MELMELMELPVLRGLLVRQALKVPPGQLALMGPQARPAPMVLTARTGCFASPWASI